MKSGSGLLGNSHGTRSPNYRENREPSELFGVIGIRTFRRMGYPFSLVLQMDWMLWLGSSRSADIAIKGI
jgi:hypothetical protein